MPEIPKKWHAIWLGSSLPEQYKSNIQTWIIHNPDYEFHLYIDSGTLPLSPKEGMEVDPDVPCNAIPAMQRFCDEFGIKLHDIAKIPECASFLSESFYNDLVCGSDKVFAFAADVLRLCILYVYGGIYTDIDCVCTAPLGTLANDNGIFVCGKQYETRFGFCDNWLIATTPKHEFLKTCLQTYHRGYNNLIFSGYRKQLGVNPADLLPTPGIKEQLFATPRVFSNGTIANLAADQELHDTAYRDFRSINTKNIGVRCECFGYVVFLSRLNDFFVEHDLEIASSVFHVDGPLRHQMANSHYVTSKPEVFANQSKMNKQLLGLRGLI